jgi:hypothetical protein
VAVLRDPSQGGGTGEFAVIQAVAPSLRVEVNPISVRDTGEIERAIAAFARSPNGGLIVTAGPTTTIHRELIIALATRHKLPAIYPQTAPFLQGLRSPNQSREGVVKLLRRRFLHLAVGAAALPAVSRMARAQAYPARPVRIIVGFGPGGGTDTSARTGPYVRSGRRSIIPNMPGVQKRSQPGDH